jgi:hypothetical protein
MSSQFYYICVPGQVVVTPVIYQLSRNHESFYIGLHLIYQTRHVISDGKLVKITARTPQSGIWICFHRRRPACSGLVATIIMTSISASKKENTVWDFRRETGFHCVFAEVTGSALLMKQVYRRILSHGNTRCCVHHET